MRKIGELKGKPIIEGNPNEIKKNQIHYKESDGNITLSERKGDNTLSSVTSGSGSGEGVKEYYYKYLGPQKQQLSDFIFSMKSNAFIKFLVRNEKGITESAIVLPAEEYANNYEYILPYIKLYDIQYQYVSTVDGYLNKGNIYNVGSGDLFDRMAKVMGVDAQTVKEQVKDMLQEITKEEYESMITYKPE